MLTIISYSRILFYSQIQNFNREIDDFIKIHYIELKGCVAEVEVKMMLFVLKGRFVGH